MDSEGNNSWHVELDDRKRLYRSLEEIDTVLLYAQSMQSGHLRVGKDGGLRPWWQRFLGMQSRYVDSLFALEWSNQLACLLFHDENWSEYRAIDESPPVTANEELRLEFSNNVENSAPIDECMDKDRAFQAVREYLAQSSRPSWLKYRFVK